MEQKTANRSDRLNRARSAVCLAAISSASVFGANAPVPGPLSPEESLRKIHLTPGYEAQLVAAEPLVRDPVAFDWDPFGRLWVVEMADYPLGMDGNGTPGGSVRVLEDSNGDGRYDRSTLFADELRFPTGIITWRDGAIITAAPDILFLKDSDGDGRADARQVLFSGFLEGNQQLRINGLRWGLDNWIYCAIGGHYRGYAYGTEVKSTLTGEKISLGSRDFRFQPETGAFQPQSGPAQFGRNRDDWGRWFGTQNSLPLWHYVLDDRYLQRNPHVPSPDPVRQLIVPRNPKVYPVSPPEKRFHSFENAGHFTSACSGMIFRDSSLFGDGEINGLVCEPFHNLVQRVIVIDSGVSFTSRRAPGEEASDFFASEDRWCRPVMVRTGPDGALWIADMYRCMIEHPDWLPENGRAELLPHYREGDDKGRIYRVVKTGRPPREIPKLNDLAPEQLAGLLASPNGWVRDKAQQLIIQRKPPSAIAHLQKLAAQATNTLARVHALWTLHGLDSLNAELVVAALRDHEPRVRENALRMAEGFTESSVITAAAGLVRDPSAKVRLQLAHSLGEWPQPLAGLALAELAMSNHEDHFMVAAIMSSVLPHRQALGDALLNEGAPAMTTFAEPMRMTALGVSDRPLLARLIAPALESEDGAFTASQMDDFGAFLQLLSRRSISLKVLTDGAEDELTGTLLRSKDLFAFAERAARDESRPVMKQISAARLLTRESERATQALRLLTEWIVPSQPPQAQREAIIAVAATGDLAVPDLLLRDWVAHGPETRGEILEQLMRREPWTVELLRRALKAGISPAAFDAARRMRLVQHESKRVREMAAELFQERPGSNRKEVVEEYRPALQLTGDPAHGAEVFDRLCLSCHQHGGTGNEIGPDLRSVVEHPPEKLLVSILDPNADVQPGYHAYTCELRSGEEIYGLISAETSTSVVLKLPEGASTTVSRQEIARLRASTLSLMPEGLEQGLSHQDIADLIAFLRRR